MGDRIFGPKNSTTGPAKGALARICADGAAGDGRDRDKKKLAA